MYQELLEPHLELHSDLPLHQKDYEGETIFSTFLMTANLDEQENWKVIHYLATNEGANINAQNHQLKTILHGLLDKVSISLEHIQKFILLFEAQIRFNLTDYRGNTAAHIMARKITIVQEAPNTHQKEIITPQLNSDFYPSFDLLERLLRKMKPLCVQNKNKQTVLHVLLSNLGMHNDLQQYYFTESHYRICEQLLRNSNYSWDLSLEDINGDNIVYLLAKRLGFERTIAAQTKYQLLHAIKELYPSFDWNASNKLNDRIQHIMMRLEHGYIDSKKKSHAKTFIDLLITEKKIDINAQGENGETLLDIMLHAKKIDYIREYIQMPGLEWNLALQNRQGNNIVHELATNTTQDVIETPEDYYDILNLIRQRYPSFDWSDKNTQGDCIQHLLVNTRDSETAWGFVQNLILDKKIDVNAQDKNGNTLLHIALNYKLRPKVLWLLERLEINVKLANNQQRTALHLAARENFTDLLLKMLSAEEKFQQFCNTQYNANTSPGALGLPRFSAEIEEKLLIIKGKLKFLNQILNNNDNTVDKLLLLKEIEDLMTSTPSALASLAELREYRRSWSSNLLLKMQENLKNTLQAIHQETHQFPSNIVKKAPDIRIADIQAHWAKIKTIIEKLGAGQEVSIQDQETLDTYSLIFHRGEEPMEHIFDRIRTMPLENLPENKIKLGQLIQSGQCSRAIYQSLREANRLYYESKATQVQFLASLPQYSYPTTQCLVCCLLSFSINPMPLRLNASVDTTPSNSSGRSACITPKVSSSTIKPIVPLSSSPASFFSSSPASSSAAASSSSSSSSFSKFDLECFQYTVNFAENDIEWAAIQNQILTLDQDNIEAITQWINTDKNLNPDSRARLVELVRTRNGYSL